MSGLRTPSTKGVEYGRVVFEAFTSGNSVEPTEVFSPIEDTGSVALKCPETNSGAIFIGWDDDVDLEEGFPLYAKDGVSFDLNTNSQPIYAVANTSADQLRVISTN